MSFRVYILRCADNSYYTGHIDNLDERIAFSRLERLAPAAELRGLPFFLCRHIHLARVSLPHYDGKKARSLRGFLPRQMFYLELQILRQ